MAWNPNVIGMSEARKAALQTILQANVADLQTALTLAPLSMASGSATSANIIIGDPNTLDNTKKFIVCIDGGGKMDATDWEAEWRQVGPTIRASSFKQTVHTNIAIYLSVDVLPVSSSSWANVTAQTEYRSRMRDRICDWVRGSIFQSGSPPPGVTMTLSSVEYGPATTVASGANSATQTLGSTAGIAVGDTLYFQTAAVSRVVQSITNGTVLVLTASVNSTTNEVVSRQDTLTNGYVAAIRQFPEQPKGYDNSFQVYAANIHVCHIVN